ncbi:hypothetical protein ACFV19_30550 [Streptomyces griseoluteus]|uniref:CurL C-terminal domain-containing protein n=1 Tax=Streptomyces griseoluteus TaxID=29306 RepID=UPI0036ACBEA4
MTISPASSALSAALSSTADPVAPVPQAAPAGLARRSPSVPRVLALSARDARSLTILCDRLADRLAKARNIDLDDVALTLDRGRERFPCRHAVVGEDRAELVRRLREPVPAETGAAAPRPEGTVAGVVLVLDGSAVDGPVADLPGIAEVLRLAEDTVRHGGNASAARSVAVLYGAARWLLDRRLTPVAVRGEDRTGALAAAAVRGDLPVAEVLRAAAADLPAPPTGDVPGPRDAVVVRIGCVPDGPARTGPEPLVLDPANGTSAARLVARLWCHGLDVDTTLGRPGRRLRLPGHPMWRRTPGEHRAEDTGRPLTPYEQRWLFYDLVRQGTSGDHAEVSVRCVRGAVPEAPALAAAFAELQRRHPALRTVFGEHGGSWRATVKTGPQVGPDLLPADPSGTPVRLAEAVRTAAARPFVLRDAPLVRCCVQEGPAHWALALAVYEPLTASVPPSDLTAELLTLLNPTASSAAAALTRPA